MELTDHQIKILKIVDAVRWNDVEHLNAYNYHLLRRAVGLKDVVITFEMEQACAFVRAHNMNPPPSPPPGPERSPWMETWDVPFWQVEAVELEPVDMDFLRSLVDSGPGTQQSDPG